MTAKTKSIDKRRPQATKRSIRSVCEAIATGSTIAEACEGIGITPTTWASWRKRKPEAHALHEQAQRAKIELFEDEIASMHEDLSDSNATNARIKLRDSRADNRRWFLRINDPARYSEKQLVGVQEIPAPEETAAQAVVRSEERKLFEQVFGPLDREPDAEPEKALTVDEWLALRPPNAPEPELLQLPPGSLGLPASALDDPEGRLGLRSDSPGFRLAREMRSEIAERTSKDGPHGEQTGNRRYATPDDIGQPEQAPQVAETPEEARARKRRVRFQLAMLDEDDVEEGNLP